MDPDALLDSIESQSVVVNAQILATLESFLLDSNLSMEKRYRCVFTLKNLGGDASQAVLFKALKDKSPLLKHEVAYVLGQMQQCAALPELEALLADPGEHSMVRHEAAEAIGAIAAPESVAFLRRFVTDPVAEVAETCQVAIDRIRWLESNPPAARTSAFASIDPAPPAPTDLPVTELRNQLLDPDQSMFTRYQALFALREKATDPQYASEAVEAAVAALRDCSALMRHEVAYVLGQMQHAAASPALQQVLSDNSEAPMVRHEAAEALGCIASSGAVPLLQQFRSDDENVVADSCVVALDIHAYFSSEQFQYADSVADANLLLAADTSLKINHEKKACK
jgi:deoxyhypusine monooxygenase